MPYLDGNIIRDNLDANTGVSFNSTIVTEWYDCSTMDDIKVDNAIYFKNTPELGGGYSKRNFEGPIDVRWFGAKCDGMCDSTAQFSKALQLAQALGRELMVVGGHGFVIKDLTIPTGVTIIGIGSDANLFGKRSTDNFFYPADGVAKIIVPSGHGGFYCLSDADHRGGSIINISFLGEEGSLYGLKINGTSWSTDRVSAVRFTNGYGIIIGNSYRAAHSRMEIRRCGIGLLFDGSLGVVNSLNFKGLVIENCRIGIYQKATSGGGSHTSNSFDSSIIENITLHVTRDLEIVESYSIPSGFTIAASILTNTGATSANFCGGVITESTANYTFTSCYFEALDGPHMYAGTNCELDFLGGYCIQGNATDIVEQNYRGSIGMSVLGCLRFYGTKIVYSADNTIYSTAVFTVSTNLPQVFNSLYWRPQSTGNRKLYQDTSGAAIDTGDDRWNIGWYEDLNMHVYGLNVADVVKSNKFVNNRQSIACNNSSSADLSASPESQIYISYTANDGTDSALTLNYDTTANSILGHKIYLTIDCSVSNSSTATIKFGTNITGKDFNLQVIAANRRIALEFTYETNKYILTNLSLDSSSILPEIALYNVAGIRKLSLSRAIPAGIFDKDTNVYYKYSSDTSTPDDGVNTIVTLDGKRFKRVLPPSMVIPVSNTTDVVTKAFLNATYPTANYPVGTVISYYNQGMEYRREASLTWSQKAITLTA